MATARIQHDFDCSEAALWQVFFFDEEYNKRLYLDTLKFPMWKVIDQKVTDLTLERRVEIHPVVDNLPGPLKALVGDKFHYIEEGKLDRKTNRYTFRALPSTLADKTTIAGEMYPEKLGDDRCRRIIDFKVDVKIMIVGKVAEAKTIDDTKSNYDRAAVFTRTYLKEKGIAK
ncbi:MAG: DUF2505 family protein [Polyangiaceae bacterium]